MLSFQTEALEESLAHAIQKLLNSRKDEYVDDTIVGSDVNEIRHVFFFLKKDRIPVFVSYNSENYRGLVEEVGNSAITLNIKNLEEGPLRRCTIRFEAFSILYQFEVLILQITRKGMVIRIPYFIQSAQHRQYKRIGVADLYMQFITSFLPIFDSATDNQVAESRFYHVIDEVKKDVPDIHLVYRVLVEEILKISSEYEVKIYREDETPTFLEETVMSEKKTIFIEDVGDVDGMIANRRNYLMTNFFGRYLEMKKIHSEEEAMTFFQKLSRQYLTGFYHKIVCAPIRIFEQVVGHIFVYTSLLETRYISVDQAHTIDIIARILSYAMSKVVIARTYLSHPLVPIVNISISGLLFHLEDEQLFDHLLFNDRIKMLLNIKHTQMEIMGEITRYFPTEKGFNMGVHFTSAAPENFKILEQFVYESSQSGLVHAGRPTTLQSI